MYLITVDDYIAQYVMKWEIQNTGKNFKYIFRILVSEILPIPVWGLHFISTAKSF